MSKYRIQRYKTSLVLDFSADDNQIISPAIDFNGLLRKIVFVVPELDLTNTADITIKDVDGYEVFRRATVAKNSSTVHEIDANNHPIRAPISGNNTITIDTSGAQTADRTFTVVLYVERG